MKIATAFLFFLLFANTLSAQNPAQMSYGELDSTVFMAQENGNYPMAIFYLEAAMEKAKSEFGEKDSTYANYLSQIAEAYIYSGNNPDETKAFITKALKIKESVFGKKSSSYARSLTILAYLHESIGQYEQAIPIYNEALNIEKKLTGISPAYLYILDNISNFYMNIGRCEEAEGLLNEAIAETKKTRYNTRDYFSLINNLAHVYQKMGRYKDSELLFQQVLDLAKQLFGENHPYYARTLNNFGELCYTMENFDKAHLLFSETLELASVLFGTNHPYYITTMHNLASLTFDMGLEGDGIALAKKTLELEKKVMGENSPSYATSLQNLSMFYKKTGNFKEAEKLVLKAIEIVEKANLTKHPFYINYLNHAANLYSSMKDFDKATQYLQKSILANCAEPDKMVKMDLEEMLKEAPKHSFLFDLQLIFTLRGCYEIAEMRYQHDKNEHHLQTGLLALQTGVEFINHLRNSFGNADDKLGVLQYASFFAEKAIKTNLNLGKNDGSAFYYAELNKSILLSDATKAQRARALSDLPEDLALQELELQQNLDELKKQILETSDEAAKIEITTQINEVNLAVHAFKNQLKDKFPKYHQLKYANSTTTAKEVQKSLNDKTLFLEYFMADSALYLFVIDQNKVELTALNIDNTTLRSKIASLRNALSDYDFITKKQGEAYQLYTETAFWFYKNLLVPALKGRTVPNLVIVADGELGHIPFEVFLVEQAPQSQTDYNKLHYLVNDYNISYNYSATLWKENLESSGRKNNSKMLALAATYTKSEKDSTATRSNRSPYLLNLRDVLIELPAAQQEVQTLKKSFQGDFWTGDAANERNFKNKATDYGIIHLAMHGILNQNSPILSSLAFTENHDSIDDNFLEAWEIAHLKLNADLVVLSACETGYGKFEQGEGVMSLARSFMYAGVPSLVVSLWQVNDYSTSLMMNSFYQYLAKGLPKDEALRRAKLDYLKAAEGIAGHPAFWSPFIQLGDSRAITLERTFGFDPTWVIGGIFITFAVGFALFRKKTTLH